MLASLSFVMRFAMNSSILLILFGFLASAYSAIFFERQTTKPGHESLCYDKNENIFYKPGEEMKWRSRECGVKICGGPSGRGTVFAQLFTCGKLYVPPNCKLSSNLDLPYPKCCEQVICPDVSSSKLT